MRKDASGKMHFKLVFVGPSMAGKTTFLKKLHTDVTGIKKGGLNSIEDPSGRTIYFDFSPFMATSNVILDIYTVAGQRRHVPDAMDKRELIDALDLGDGIPVFETIAIEGIGVKRAFQSLARDVMLKKLYQI